MSFTDEPTTWTPSHLLSPSPTNERTPFSLIILNQPLALRPTIYQALFHHATHTIAADGGANRLYSILHPSKSKSPASKSPSLPLSLIIGDLDSLSPRARDYFSSQGVRIIHDTDQYSTDFEKAFNWLTTQRDGTGGGGKETDIVVLGGLGGRIDQGLSTLHHIYKFQSSPSSSSSLQGGRMYLVSSESITFLLKKGNHRIQVKQDTLFESASVGAHEEHDLQQETTTKRVRWGLGKHIGIIPMNGASVLTTKGLEWDVQDWKTEFGGQMSTSNWVREEWVDVQTSADVLFTIDLKIEVDGKEEGNDADEA